MKTSNTIRPTNLQPRLYREIKRLAKTDDYIVIVNQENEPVCVLAGYSLIKDIELEKRKKEKMKTGKTLADQIEEYYQNIPQDEKDIMDSGIEDLYEY